MSRAWPESFLLKPITDPETLRGLVRLAERKKARKQYLRTIAGQMGQRKIIASPVAPILIPFFRKSCLNLHHCSFVLSHFVISVVEPIYVRAAHIPWV